MTDSQTEFLYVVEKIKPQKVCFLSTKERGLYDKLKKEEVSRGPYNLENTSAMYKLLNKIRSHRGVPGLCDKTPRFRERYEETPGPFRAHEFLPEEIKEIEFPFGSRIPRWIDRYNGVPGPGTYKFTKKCQTTAMCQAFGGPRKLFPAVDTICMTKPHHVCERCQDICDGDYWHLDENIYLCNICMIIERHKKVMYTKKALEKFKQIRNCSYMHQHEGTSAKIRLMSEKLIKIKERKENYLNLFIKPFSNQPVGYK